MPIGARKPSSCGFAGTVATFSDACNPPDNFYVQPEVAGNVSSYPFSSVVYIAIAAADYV